MAEGSKKFADPQHALLKMIASKAWPARPSLGPDSPDGGNEHARGIARESQES